MVKKWVSSNHEPFHAKGNIGVDVYVVLVGFFKFSPAAKKKCSKDLFPLFLSLLKDSYRERGEAGLCLHWLKRICPLPTWAKEYCDWLFGSRWILIVHWVFSTIHHLGELQGPTWGTGREFLDSEREQAAQVKCGAGPDKWVCCRDLQVQSRGKGMYYAQGKGLGAPETHKQLGTCM